MTLRLAGALLLAWPGSVCAQVAILQIQVVEGEGGVHPPGSRSSRPLVVDVTDETGRPAGGASVTFTLPEDGPGGTFTNGLRTEVVTADARGRAALRGLQVNRSPGRFHIRITASLEQARAGTVSFQYVGGIKEPGGGSPATPVARSGRPHSRWPLIALAVGAAAAGGIAAGAAGGSKSTPPAAMVPAVAAIPATPLSIGSPSLTIGRP